MDLPLMACSVAKLSEGLQVPAILFSCEPVPKDVQIAVICADLEVGIVWAVPLIQQLLNEVIAVAEPKTHWSFVRLLAGVAFDVQCHSSPILA